MHFVRSAQILSLPVLCFDICLIRLGLGLAGKGIKVFTLLELESISESIPLAFEDQYDSAGLHGYVQLNYYYYYYYY